MAFLSEEATANIDERAGPTSASSEQEQGGAQPYVGIKISRLGYHNVSAYVQRVRPGSPAAEAGIQADDLIISINGRRIHDAADYKDLLESLSPGQSARFVLKRGPKVITLDVQIGAQ